MKIIWKTIPGRERYQVSNDGKERQKFSLEQKDAKIAELEKRGILGVFSRVWNNPAGLKHLKVVSGKMRADKIDLKDPAAVSAWSEKHQDEIDAGAFKAGAKKAQKTVVNSGPSLGRNDPCHCGSGKKFKKCCVGK